MGLQSIFRLHSKHLGEAREAAALLAACAGCPNLEACDDACPAGVPIARVVRRLGEIAAASAARPIARRAT
jgi:succinate dehydrogenase/fumarate reductase-like Fe-S protein